MTVKEPFTRFALRFPLTLGLGAVCGAIWYGSTRRRYRELERMSRDKKKDGPPQAASFNDHD